MSDNIDARLNNAKFTSKYFYSFENLDMNTQNKYYMNWRNFK